MICPQGIAFFLIIRPDQEKSTKKPLASFAPLRFCGFAVQQTNKTTNVPHYVLKGVPKARYTVKSMGYKFNEIADTLKMHPVTAGRCAEKGRKLVDSYEGMWEVLK